MIEYFQKKNIQSVSCTFLTYEKNIFCGSPYFYLVKWDENNEVGITIHDNDDLDIGYIYLCKDKEEQEKIFHELLNYLYDLNNQFIHIDNLIDEKFFPIFEKVQRNHW